MTVKKDSWFVRNVTWIKSFIRITLGVVWLIDGSLKFQPGFVDAFSNIIKSVGDGQPAWLQPWFNFWSNVTAPNPALFVYSTGVLELLLGIALVLGFMRKITYICGLLLSLFIWAIPEGFGGTYGPGATDIGTGAVYAFVFLSLLVINAAFGPSKYSLDAVIERRCSSWSKLAES